MYISEHGREWNQRPRLVCGYTVIPPPVESSRDELGETEWSGSTRCVCFFDLTWPAASRADTTLPVSLSAWSSYSIDDLDRLVGWLVGWGGEGVCFESWTICWEKCARWLLCTRYLLVPQ